MRLGWAGPTVWRSNPGKIAIRGLSDLSFGLIFRGNNAKFLTLFPGHAGAPMCQVQAITDRGSSGDVVEHGAFLRRFLKLPATIMLLLTASANPLLATGRWLPVGPDGGAITSIAADARMPERIYAGTSRGALYRSLDGGGSWEPAANGLEALFFESLTIDPFQPLRVFAATGSQLFVSADGAESWQAVAGLAGRFVSQVLISPSGPTEVFAAAHDEVYRSTDGGESWFRANQGLGAISGRRINALAASAAEPLQLYAGTDQGLLHSSDRGETWRIVQLGLAERDTVFSIAVDPSDSSRLYLNTQGMLLRSSDGGETWSQTFGIPEGWVIAQVLVDPADSSQLYAATNGGVYRSQDFGQTWRAMTSNLPRHSIAGMIRPITVRALTLIPQPFRLYAASDVGVFAADSPGGSWQRSDAGLRGTSVNDLSFDHGPNPAIYAAANTGIFQSLDGGDTWQNLLLGNWKAVAVDPTNPEQVFAGGNGVMRSLDGGLNWMEANSGLVVGFFLRKLSVRALVIDPSAPRRLLAGGDEGVYLSVNGGSDWSPLVSFGAVVSALAVDPGSSSKLYVGTDRGLFRSLDGGETWRAANQGLGEVDDVGLVDLTVEVIALHPFQSSTLYLGSREGGIFRSRDDAGQWEPVNQGLGNLSVRDIGIDSTHPSTLYAATEGGVFRSVDEGEHWISLSSGLSDLFVHTLALDGSEPLRLYAGTERAGVSRLEPSELVSFAHFGDGTEGGESIVSRLLLYNPDDRNQASASLFLRGGDGEPLEVDLSGIQVHGRLDLAFPGLALRVAETEGTGPLRAGWVGIHSDRELEGVVIFESGAGAAGVGRSPRMSSFFAPAEFQSGRNLRTGLALANLDSAVNPVRLQLFDPDRKLLAAAQLQLPPLGHRALFLDEIPWLPEPAISLDWSNFLGIVEGAAQAPLSVTMIQTRPEEFVTFPVTEPMALQDESPTSSPVTVSGEELETSLHFAHFGNGTISGYQVSSSMLFLNRNLLSPARARIDFKDDQGDSINEILFPATGGGPIEVELPPGGLRALETDGRGELVSGSATVVADQPLEGVLIFSGTAGAAAVAASPPMAHGWLAPVVTQRVEGFNTGVALMNLEKEPQAVLLKLCDESGSELAQVLVDLPGEGHLARFLDELPWRLSGEESPDFGLFRGLLKGSSPLRATATVIRARPGQFVTLPVTPSPR